MNTSALSSAVQALQSSIDSLETRSAWLETCLQFFILLVVIGVVMEVFVVIAEYRHGMADFRRATIGNPERPSRALFALGLAGSILVALGVAGELKMGADLRKIQDDLKSKHRQVSALFQKAASDAIERSAKLEKQSLDMMAKLRLQGSRVALLLEPDTQKLFDALARFRDQKVDVGTCAERENEMGFTLTTMMMTLQQQHWNVKWLEPNPACTTGMRVLVRDDAPESTKSAAMALGKVLITLGVMSPKLKPFDVFERPKGNAVILGTAWEPSTADSVLLMVMAHPLGSQLP